MKEAFVVVFVEKEYLFCQRDSVKDLHLKVDIVRISHSDKVNWTLKNTLPWEKKYFLIMKDMWKVINTTSKTLKR